MNFGVSIFPTRYSIGPAELGRALEERGFESLFVPEPATRFAVLRERILAMKEIWTSDEAEFHGPHVDFDPLWQWPKPVQRPHPPVLVAGNGPGTLERVLEYGDGWIPIPGRGAVPLGEGTALLRRRAAEQGRPPIPVTGFGARAEPDVIAHYAGAGLQSPP